MRQTRQIRVIKKEERRQTERRETSARREATAEADRATKTVISDWVREHRQRAEEFRQNYATLLEKTGFRLAGVPAR
jgi:hypothetical protein